MKIDLKFLGWVAGWYVLFTAAGLVLLSGEGMEAYERSLAAGCLVSLLNFLAGFLSVEYAFEKSHTVFLKIVLGGMVVRLLGMVLIVLLLVGRFEFESLSLMLTLLGYYALNLTLEIVFLQKKVTLKNISSHP